MHQREEKIYIRGGDLAKDLSTVSTNFISKGSARLNMLMQVAKSP